MASLIENAKSRTRMYSPEMTLKHHETTITICADNKQQLAKMPLPPALRQSYCSAVYLNNAAATLMARGDTQAALDSLKGSLVLMGSIVSRESAAAEEPRSVNIKETEQNLALPRPFPRPLPRQSSMDLSVRNFDGTLVTSVFAKTENTREAQSGLFLRLDDVDMDDHDLMHDFVPAILLSNLALCHLALAPRPLVDESSFLEQVLQLLSMATTVLGMQNRRFENVSEGRLTVAIVIWNNICYAFQTPSSHDRHCEWGHAKQRLESLQMLAHCWSNQITSCIEHSNPAGAA